MLRVFDHSIYKTLRHCIVKIRPPVFARKVFGHLVVFAKICGGILPGEFFEVVNEMRLIVIAAFGRNKAPIHFLLPRYGFKYFLKAQNAAEKFGREADLRLKLALELALADAGHFLQPLNRHQAISPNQQIDSSVDGVIGFIGNELNVLLRVLCR